ncbi:unnamed protein product [Didymodactylos carnosus]|uniref:Uncharacterized protein n=1 Tax=Didymodactylos carnosus TaxID=1234261 RepID=A0A814TY27_9BILA|nr:unnamed protein product [Didymodactylos carnosus]CAF1167353.1 unnamed protein product [Didymodactylos carnosus]CAF3736328.1 unnamed protein product [Didymodactylos carnosus]CAF3930913.1 unnamed protein product [Didymodactylos carnosus]
MNWTNGWYNNVTRYAPGINGYPTPLQSGHYVSYYTGTAPVIMTSANGSLFTLDSFYASAAWRDNLQFTLNGYQSSTVIKSQTFTLQVFNVSYLAFDGWNSLDTLTFTTSGGTKNSMVGTNSSQMAFDNLCITFT